MHKKGMEYIIQLRLSRYKTSGGSRPRFFSMTHVLDLPLFEQHLVIT